MRARKQDQFTPWLFGHIFVVINWKYFIIRNIPLECRYFWKRFQEKKILGVNSTTLLSVYILVVVIVTKTSFWTIIKIKKFLTNVGSRVDMKLSKWLSF